MNKFVAGEDMYCDIEDFCTERLFTSYDAQIKALCKSLFEQLQELSIDFKVHARKRDFVLWSSLALHRKVNRDFLTVYTRADHLLLIPKFYGVPWKSKEILGLQRKMYNLKLDNNYLQLIYNAYKSISNEDSSLLTNNHSTAAKPSVKNQVNNSIKTDVEMTTTMKNALIRFANKFNDSTFELFLEIFQINPETIIREARPLLERILRKHYEKLYGNKFAGNLFELIKEFEAKQIFTCRATNLMHTVRTIGNIAIHNGLEVKRLKDEALLVLQALIIIFEELLEEVTV